MTQKTTKALSSDSLSSLLGPTLDDSWLQTADAFHAAVPSRSRDLIVHFLPKGYRATTLSSVNPDHFETALYGKVHLGMLITLYDDLADNPRLKQPLLLEKLYKIPFYLDEAREVDLSKEESCLYQLALRIGKNLLASLQQLPNYSLLEPLFKFDLDQFYQANRYSELITNLPEMASTFESARYGDHNMGMIAAGMIDLMASTDWDTKKLGKIRTLLSHGQRFGRLCNVITTFERELLEGDITNEIYCRYLDDNHASLTLSGIDGASVAKQREALECEMNEILQAVVTLTLDLQGTVNVNSYADGLRYLASLHTDMKEVI